MKTFNQLLVIALATFSLSAQAQGTFSSHSAEAIEGGVEMLNSDLKPSYIDMDVIQRSTLNYQKDNANDKITTFQATNTKTKTNTPDFTLIRF